MRPLADSEARIERLRASVAGAERALEDLGILLGAEAAKLARSFRDRQEVFLPLARAEARKQLEDELRVATVGRTRLRAEA